MASFFESLSKAAHREPSRSKRGRSLNPEAAQPSTAKSADLLRSDEKISLLGQKRIFSTPIGSKNNQKWRRRRGCRCSPALFSENQLPALRQPEEPVAFISVSRVFAPAPGSAFADASSIFASPRLRQSLAALGSGYGLNEKPKTANGNSLARLGPRAASPSDAERTLESSYFFSGSTTYSTGIVSRSLATCSTKFASRFSFFNFSLISDCTSTNGT